MTFSARTGSQHKKPFLIDKLVTIFFSFSCSQNAHINLLYVFVNLFGKYFHYMNILWTVCCEYLLSNIYINSVLVSHFSDTVSLLSYFASYKDISHLKYCEKSNSTYILLLLKLLLKFTMANESKPWLFQSSDKHQWHFSSCSGSSSNCNILTQILPADSGQYKFLHLVVYTAVWSPYGLWRSFHSPLQKWLHCSKTLLSNPLGSFPVGP